MNETRRAILHALADGPISGPALADQLDVSRAAVWKHVEALRDAGFVVESRGDGYVLAAVPEFGGLAVEYELDAPFEVEYHDAIPSTNDRARELADAGAENVVVLADEQTGGRGRLDREWRSPPGGIWMSVVLRPSLPPAKAPLLTLAAAVGVTRAARDRGVDAGIKWPNDVLVRDEGVADQHESERPSEDGAASDGQGGAGANAAADAAGAAGRSAGRGGSKLCGVLTEMEGEASRVSWVVVGMGINANVDPGDLGPGATSLRAECGDVDRRAFVQDVLSEFAGLASRPADVLGAWRELTWTLGRPVRVETPDGTVEGVAADVTEYGALVVETGSAREVVHAGDCEHLRPLPGE